MGFVHIPTPDQQILLTCKGYITFTLHECGYLAADPILDVFRQYVT